MIYRWLHIVNAGLVGLTLAHWASGRIQGVEILAGADISIAGVLVVASICYGAAWTVWAVPSSMNVPNQEAYDALSTAAKRTIIAETLQPFLYVSATLWLAVVLTVAFIPALLAIVLLVLVGHFVELALAVHFLFLKLPREIKTQQQIADSQGDV